MAKPKITVSKLPALEPGCDWHDKPIAWIVNGPENEFQKFSTKAWALEYAKILGISMKLALGLREFKLTNFESAKFSNSGDHLRYITSEGKNVFVARFKHRGPITRAKLKKVLIKHYTVEEYLLRMVTEAPLKILQNDGLLVFKEGRLYLEGKML